MCAIFTRPLLLQYPRGGRKHAGGLVLTYLVQGKPRLTDIKYQGNTKLKNAKLQKKVRRKSAIRWMSASFSPTARNSKVVPIEGLPGTQVKYVLNIDESAGRGHV